METKEAQVTPAEGEEKKQKSIMIVDDDLDFLKMAKRALERKGFVVDARASAPRWDELQRSDPAVVFMDIELNGENGIEICQAIKTSGRVNNLPVILISGHGEERLKDEALRCKADGFLSKPFSAQLLVDLAQHYSHDRGIPASITNRVLLPRNDRRSPHGRARAPQMERMDRMDTDAGLRSCGAPLSAFIPFIFFIGGSRQPGDPRLA